MFIRCTEKRCDGNFFNPIRFPSFVENIFTNGRKKKEKKRRREIFKEKITIVNFFLFQIFTSLEKKRRKIQSKEKRNGKKKQRELVSTAKNLLLALISDTRKFQESFLFSSSSGLGVTSPVHKRDGEAR